MFGFLNRHPWLYLVAIFATLIAVWAVTIVIAVKHGPKEIPVHSSPP